MFSPLREPTSERFFPIMPYGRYCLLLRETETPFNCHSLSVYSVKQTRGSLCAATHPQFIVTKYVHTCNALLCCNYVPSAYIPFSSPDYVAFGGECLSLTTAYTRTCNALLCCNYLSSAYIPFSLLLEG